MLKSGNWAKMPFTSGVSQVNNPAPPPPPSVKRSQQVFFIDSFTLCFNILKWLYLKLYLCCKYTMLSMLSICNKRRYEWIIVPNTSLLLNKHIKSFLPILFTCSKMKNIIFCYNEYHIYLSCIELNKINM